MSKRIRVITLCCVTTLCCVALIVAGTYALFSDSAEVTNHLQAGQLKARLYRDELIGTVLCDDGLLATVTDDTRKEFTGKTAENIFGLNERSVIVPGCDFVAKLTLVNEGNVAISYYLEFVFDGDEELANQLELTLVTNDKKETVKLSELGKNNTWGAKTQPLGQILQGTWGEFSVELKFVDDEENDKAQNKRITLDVIVHAIQDASHS